MTVGEALVQARREAGLTLTQVSERTRIRRSLIADIENDDYAGCGGDFYARGHIRAIARAVGIDPEPLVAEYDAACRAPGAASATSLEELLASSGPQRPRRRRWPAAASLVMVALLGVVGYWFLAGGHGGADSPQAALGHAAQHHQARNGQTQSRSGPLSPAASPVAHRSGQASASPSPSPGPAAAALSPAGASAFGPNGPGGGDNPQLARLAIDGSQATAWHSDWYTSAQFGNLYGGTGLLVDMGHPVTITSARVDLGRGGAGLELRVGSAPALANLRLVARTPSAGAVARLAPPHPARGRYLLLWFTRLPPDPSGTFQASVYDITVRGQG